jgi:hypothetical protein
MPYGIRIKEYIGGVWTEDWAMEMVVHDIFGFTYQQYYIFDTLAKAERTAAIWGTFTSSRKTYTAKEF